MPIEFQQGSLASCHVEAGTLLSFQVVNGVLSLLFNSDRELGLF